MAQFCHPCTGVNDFIDVFVVEGAGMICKVKTRLIQEMTQIVCLSGWTIENIKSILDGLDQMERCNAKVTGKK